jgi:hypothetical protein
LSLFLQLALQVQRQVVAGGGQRFSYRLLNEHAPKPNGIGAIGTVEGVQLQIAIAGLQAIAVGDDIKPR